MSVLLRFAPSPTGPLHLGGLRTALINHLFSRKNGGKWILRIEDTDASRYDAASLDNIRTSLEWAELDYDFGPGKDGPHGPYIQSQRRDLYLSYAQKLLDSGNAYRCFCSPTRLTEIRTNLAKQDSPFTYDRYCEKLTEEEVARRVRSGEKSVVRLNIDNVPPREKARDMIFDTFTDGHGSLPTDPILMKSDLNPTYHLASVADDHEMGITHVFRGEEWLASLPLHLDLYAALNLKPPQFAHLPLLLNEDGSKMSKRHGDARILDYIEKNYEPDAVLSWLAFAGWGTSGVEKDEMSFLEPLTLSELIDKFKLWRPLNRRSVLDPRRLAGLNRKSIVRQLQTDGGLRSLAKRAKEMMLQQYPNSKEINEVDFGKLVQSAEGRLHSMNDFPELYGFFFTEPNYTLAMWNGINKELYINVIGIFMTSLEAKIGEKRPLESKDDAVDLLNGFLHDEGLKQKIVMPILRHVLTGRKDGLGVADIFHLLGPQKSMIRLQRALASISQDSVSEVFTNNK